MTEPSSAGIAGYFGIKVSTFIAHILGQLISLSFMAPMGIKKKITTVITGTIIAYYGTQLTLHLFPSLAPADGAVGFVIGLTAMSIVKTIIDEVPNVIKRLLGRVQ